MKHKERRGNVELRLDEDGTVDEVVIWDNDDKVIFHMEMMDESTYWMRAGKSEEGKDLVVNLSASTGMREVFEDTEGPKMMEGPIITSMYEWE